MLYYTPQVTYTTGAYTLQATATITINKNQVKNYNGNFYLKDKQEFEIELFNPTQTTKLAKIEINGKPISTSGIVLKPGRRVHLERFLDTPKRFAFETYTIAGDDAAALAAITQNGNIVVKFYDEQAPLEQPDWSIQLTSSNTTANCYYSNCCTTTSANMPQYRGSVGGQSVNSFGGERLRSKAVLDSAEKETGRVEQGSSSNQRFTNYSGQFNSYPANTVYIKLLPFSEKPLEISDLAEYCTQCGTKNKKGNYIFCPKCGNKYSN